MIKTRLINFLNKPLMEHPVIFIRLWLGVAMIYHGFPGIFNRDGIVEFAQFLEGVGVPFPLFNAYLSQGTELVAGALVFIGLFTRIASFALLVNFSVAFLIAHHGLILGEGEMAFLYWLLSLTVFVSGSERYRIDSYWHREGHAPE